MKTIIYVTSNKTKVLYANEALNKLEYNVVSRKIDIIEPREENPEKVVIEKAIQASEQVKAPLIVEDSGIFIYALKGFPKTFIHFVENTIGVEGILKMMDEIDDRRVEFRQSLAYMEPGISGPKVFSYVDGGYVIANKIWSSKYEDLGEFDKILIPPGESKPLCMFSKKWRAKRDVQQNEGKIHYHQLAKWLSGRKL